MQMLLFDVDDIRLALPASAVLELHRAVAVSALPGAPEGVLGAVNVRGKVLPVLDLRLRFGLMPRAERPEDVLIRVDAGGAELLLLADQACELRDAGAPAAGDFEAAPGVRFPAHFANVDGTLAFISDPRAFFDAPARALLAAALASYRSSAARAEGSA